MYLIKTVPMVGGAFSFKSDSLLNKKKNGLDDTSLGQLTYDNEKSCPRLLGYKQMH